MDRDEMVDFLIDSDFHYIMECGNGPELLDSYLGFGFKGYHNFTLDELRYEVAQREVMNNA
jgi:hypothetical protein